MPQQYKFNPADYIKLREIKPVLKKHGVEKIEWFPNSQIITFFGDPLTAVVEAERDGDISHAQASIVFDICHPDKKIYR